MDMYVDKHKTLIIHEMLRQTRQDKTTQHNSPKAVFFLRCLRWDSNPQPSTFQVMALTNWATKAAQLAGFKSHIARKSNSTKASHYLTNRWIQIMHVCAHIHTYYGCTWQLLMYMYMIKVNVFSAGYISRGATKPSFLSCSSLAAICIESHA